jgi:Cu+-exporting ATPase
VSNVTEETVAVGKVGVGDRLVIRNQELIPADGILMDGRASIDYSFVTGESDPHELKVGDRVYAGGRQIGGAIQIEVIKSVEESYLVSLWSNLKNDHTIARTRSEKVLSTVTAGIGKYFTLAVLVIATATAWWWLAHDPSRWIHAFTSVLLVACPCAIALSSPFVFGTAMRLFSEKKLFLRHPDVVDALSRVDTIVFDKTGTLTDSIDRQVTFVGDPLTKREEAYVAALARHSIHPLSRALAALSPESSEIGVVDFQESIGHGIAGKIGEVQVRLGRDYFVSSDNAPGGAQTETAEKGRVYLSMDGNTRGYFVVGSAVRQGMKEEVDKLGGKFELLVLTGDSNREQTALKDLFGERAAVEFNLLPHDKRDRIEKLRRAGKRVLMLGDGLNDAGALGAADVGIAVTEDTSAFAPGCDGILHASNLARLSRFLDAARLSRRVVFASFAISIVYNIVGLGFAAAGHLSPLVSAILMPVSSVSVVGFGTAATWLAARRKGLV